MASTTTHTLMTSKSVSQNWRLPSYGLTIYQTSVRLSTQIHSSTFPKQCENPWMLHMHLDASESSKNPRGNTRKFTFPSRHVLSGPGPIHDCLRQSLWTPSSLPPDIRVHSPTPLILPTLYPSISCAKTPITSGTGNLI